jgi:hypothetical protein
MPYLRSETVAKYIAKPATAFAAGAAIGGYMRPGMDVVIMGVAVPAWVLAGAVCAIGAEVSAVANKYVFPHVTELSVLDRPIETAYAISVNAGAGALAYSLLAPGALGEVGVTELLFAAAAAELISGYTTDRWIKPMLDQWM